MSLLPVTRKLTITSLLYSRYYYCSTGIPTPDPTQELALLCINPGPSVLLTEMPQGMLVDPDTACTEVCP